MTENTSDSSREQPSFSKTRLVAFVLSVIAGLIIPGLAVAAFEALNMPIVADLAWILGYGTAVLLLWYVWIRPIDLTGSIGHTSAETVDSQLDEKTSPVNTESDSQS